MKQVAAAAKKYCEGKARKLICAAGVAGAFGVIRKAEIKLE